MSAPSPGLTPDQAARVERIRKALADSQASNDSDPGEVAYQLVGGAA